MTTRNYGLIIPHEWENAQKIIETAKATAKNYYIILHDCDVTEYGELKKSHYHIIITLSSPRKLSTIHKYFKDYPEILENSIEKIKNITGAKQYLIHFNNPEKFQYDKKLVLTNDKKYLDLFLETKSKETELEELLEMFNKPYPKTEKEFLENYSSFLIGLNSYQKFNALMQLRRDFRSRFVYD